MEAKEESRAPKALGQAGVTLGMMGQGMWASKVLGGVEG
jgi:hypothetical protein